MSSGSSWVGANDAGEGDPWLVEIEPDCFSHEVGHVISLWAEQKDEGKEHHFLAEVMPEQAREMARALSECADYVEQRRKETGRDA